jgi:hypothetical protein
VSKTWPEPTLFDRIAVKQRLLLEIDLEGDFTETYTEDPAICISNYQLAVEAARQDRCFCNSGEEKSPRWFAQKRDLSPESETDSDETDEIKNLETGQHSTASANGLVEFEYVKAVCPRSRDRKRRLCHRSSPAYPLITGNTREKALQ